MKRYLMVRDAGGRATAAVVDGKKVYGLPHLEHHSPDGFEWGYYGSGPADLARSIVGDLLRTPQPAPREYQLVKRELVAVLPLVGGVLKESEILEVLGR